MSAARLPPDPPHPPPPTEPAQVYVLEDSLLSQVEIRSVGEDGSVRRWPGIIIALNVEDGTVDIQYDMGILKDVLPYRWENRLRKVTWQWPGLEDPTDPKDFREDPQVEVYRRRRRLKKH